MSVLWNSSFGFIIALYEDIYYCGIPLICRECNFLYTCRSSFKEKRKCRNGCIRLNILRENKRKQYEEDKMNALVAYYEDLEKQIERRRQNKNK